AALRRRQVHPLRRDGGAGVRQALGGKSARGRHHPRAAGPERRAAGTERSRGGCAMSGAPDPLKSNAADLTGYLDARDHQARDELLAALAPTREEVRRLRAWFRQETPAMVAFANEQRAALA